MPEFFDLLAPLPTVEDYNVEALLEELDIKVDRGELIWE